MNFQGRLKRTGPGLYLASRCGVRGLIFSLQMGPRALFRVGVAGKQSSAHKSLAGSFWPIREIPMLYEFLHIKIEKVSVFWLSKTFGTFAIFSHPFVKLKRGAAATAYLHFFYVTFFLATDDPLEVLLEEPLLGLKALLAQCICQVFDEVGQMAAPQQLRLPRKNQETEAMLRASS